MPVSGDKFRQVMRQWASGVTVVTVRHETAVRAILVTSFLSVGLDPPTVLVSIKRDGETHRLLEAARTFAVNFLHQGQGELAQSLGYANDPDARALRSVPFHAGVTGAPLLDDCACYLDCRVMDAYETRDHTLYVGVVEDAAGEGQRPLLHWDRAFRRLQIEEAN
jgi:3-hydroxy-9,10-secoandrosta-1,3,5(10)-triene-9,17-dione monooxygenase reductase component